MGQGQAHGPAPSQSENVLTQHRAARPIRAAPWCASTATNLAKEIILRNSIIDWLVTAGELVSIVLVVAAIAVIAIGFAPD